MYFRHVRGRIHGHAGEDVGIWQEVSVVVVSSIPDRVRGDNNQTSRVELVRVVSVPVEVVSSSYSKLTEVGDVESGIGSFDTLSATEATCG